MVSFKKKFYFLNVRDTWFRYEPTLRDLVLPATYSFVQKHTSGNGFCIKRLSHTVEIDLHQQTDVIYSGLKSTVKQEIRRAEKEGIVCVYENDTEKFIDFYNEFAALKKIYPAKKKIIDNIGPFFKTSFAYRGNELLAAHSHIIDKELNIARLFQSASGRLNEKFNKTLTGIANKYLTINDIWHYKQHGFEKYDFGGYAKDTNNKSLKGINEFKLSFGGKITECINYDSPTYFILNKISALIDRRY